MASFLGVSPARVLKTLLFDVDGKSVAVLVRGDHDVNEVKLKNLLDAAWMSWPMLRIPASCPVPPGAYLSREKSSPLIILNKDHPSTKRLETVISIGDRVNLNCNITPGTHPEQNVLCSCDSLSGLEIIKTPTGVKLNREIETYTIEKF